MHCTCKNLLSGVFTPALVRVPILPPSFLLPAFSGQSSSFSTSAIHSARRRRTGLPNSGVSALRHTGFRRGPLKRYTYEDLPQPVLDPAQRTIVETDEDHGLWGFFDENRNSMATPQEMAAHGRAWTVPELRMKDWDDLHRLWWVCVKDINRITTTDEERDRVGNMYGRFESEERIKEIKQTQKAIKHTLTERWYAWENARSEAMLDPAINMYANTQEGEIAYFPKSHPTRRSQRKSRAIAARDESGSQIPNNEL